MERINANANAAVNGNTRGYRVDRLVGGPTPFNIGGMLRQAAPAAANPPPPREDQIDNLVAMGFAREDVISALARANNDVNRAAELLLGS